MKKKECLSSETDSGSESDVSLPKLSTLRTSMAIQKQVDVCLRELEPINETSGTEFGSKLKSKRRTC